MTPERQERIQDALGKVGEEWTPTRIAQGRRALARKRRRRRAARTGTGMVATAAVVVLGVVALPDAWRAGPFAADAGEEKPPAMEQGTLRLADGSRVAPLDARAAMMIERDAEDRSEVALFDGKARFDVVRREERRFVVAVHGIRVVVLGTRFDIEIDMPRVFVRVLQGRVAVHWADGERVLTGGQSGLFPIEGARPESAGKASSDGSESVADAVDMWFEADDPALAAESASSGEPASGGKARPAKNEDWRHLVRRGDYESAYRASRRQSIGTDIEDLLLAADAARLSGHPREALPLLRRAIRTHRKHPRAYLAAFTLGRVYLQLGEHADAARAFHQARQLDRRQVLREQALVREIEAWAEAGETERAGRGARAYLDRYPKGHYADRVRRYHSAP